MTLLLIITFILIYVLGMVVGYLMCKFSYEENLYNMFYRILAITRIKNEKLLAVYKEFVSVDLYNKLATEYMDKICTEINHGKNL